MNGAVHYGMTRRWAQEAGFSDDEAEAIARATIAVDRLHPGRWPSNWAWHYRIAGANKRARVLADDARRSGDLVLLGEALHCRQDALTHGFWGPLLHWPGIDIWERRSDRIRRAIEAASRAMLAEFRAARAQAAGACEET